MIEFPGVVVRERIAQTNVLDVYRCTRSSDNRSLVLKFGRDDVEWPQGMREQLLAGCELHKKVNHNNVVPLFHYGIEEDTFYSLEGYISGPDLAQQLITGISLDSLVAQLAGISSGLTAVHQAGIVHGDIKLEHIKMRGNGTPQLLDFSLATPIGETPHGWGSPGYLAPELQSPAAHDTLAPSSDIYSLGVVLYRCLAGRLPFDADRENANLSYDQVLRLPDHFTSLQPIVETALARNPADRYPNLAEFNKALQATAQDLKGHQQLPQIRSAPIATRELRELNSAMLTTPLDSSRQARRSKKEGRRRVMRRSALTIVFLIATATVGYYIERSELITADSVLSRIGIIEDPLLTAAWNQAQSLGRDSNQDLAAIVAAYQRVLAIDPRHAGALERLLNLESEWKTNTTEALAQGNIEAVSTRLEAAKIAFDDDVEWLQLRTQLSNRERAERIVKSAELLLTSHGLSDLPSATAAIQSYQEVLRLSPEHPAALQALTELSEHYAGLASRAISDGQLNSGISLLERATAANNAVPLLDEVRKQISQATSARAAIDDLLQSARRYRSENQLLQPPGENAAELYHRVLATDPENAIAIQGLIEITSQVAANAEELLSRGQIAEVDSLVNQAQAASLDDVGVAEIRKRVDAERQRQVIVTNNLTQAKALMAIGYLTAPPENNAVAQLRDVQQIDPSNVEANDLLQLCAQRLAAVAMEAHEIGLEGEAKQYLDLALAITPDVESWIALREGWEDA